ncbi:MAG: cysteine methyltransferase [Flammeovirgaceae bacterium]|nr:cysteine methyltransferase [Flammeovirgaceae bacterium]HCX24868.1 cysteine methyltransferase [Cytophagales bacterium]|tara:strand:+ start:962 stop:1813 length:852 start_codon:yes stop_codon:yes gene_type:complete
MTKSLEEHINYQRIAEAISYISDSYRSQPKLGELAEEASMSPFHFQRLFSEWVGVSPKKFMQYLSVQHAKKVLLESQTTLFKASYELGLSGTGRLHDLFVTLEGMTPGEYKNGGSSLTINYGFTKTIFGLLIICTTEKGVCHMAFCSDEEDGVASLRNRFPKAGLTPKTTPTIIRVIDFFENGFKSNQSIHLHLSGTPFQVKVWETLLKIPSGSLATYGTIAKQIGSPKASRAVGTAIGANPIAFLIPCHRVIQSTGHFGGYMWGPERKQVILGWEGVKAAND